MQAAGSPRGRLQGLGGAWLLLLGVGTVALAKGVAAEAQHHEFAGLEAVPYQLEIGVRVVGVENRSRRMSLERSSSGPVRCSQL